MARKILIVDDNDINRQMLVNALYKEYDIFEAANGKEALDFLHRNYKMLSAVLLDIVMPEMDGYEVLRRMRENAPLSQLPVIMVTGADDEDARVNALSLGANDFVLKPFNPDIVKHCLRNCIALRETASILNAIQKDKLTGLYNREAFFDKAAVMIKAQEPGYYILSCFDIDNFKLINDQYGAAEGDRILKEIGGVVKKNMDEIGGLGSRISADNFAALIPVAEKDTDVLRQIEEKKLTVFEQQTIVFSVGRYVITDVNLPVSASYDRAYIAKRSVKGRFDKHLAYFDETMLQRLLQDQQIIGEMEGALANHQFEVWFQPQYNHVSGALIGAEALVRWRHPQKGIILPGDFIPLFEQNGFVYELDKYVWQETCRYLRKWLDEGLAPLPVSVNISRYDIFRIDLFEVITGYVKKYNIPIELLRLEITESAFVKSTVLIVEIVKQLIDFGFTVEIDDFGSGYSSLNTLKSVPAQVVKLDMRFLEGEDDTQRGGNILESIVRMVKWLGMSVIAEGVETRKQSDFLKSIGCNHVQGYLYALPMPACDYEEHFRDAAKEKQLVTIETEQNLDNNRFWSPQSIDTLIFNSDVGAACIYEYHDITDEKRTAQSLLDYLPCGAGICVITENDVHIAYLNKRYYTYFKHNSKGSCRSAAFDFIHPDDRNKLREAMLPVLEGGGEAWCIVRISDGTDEYLPFRLTGVAVETEGNARGTNVVYMTIVPVSYEELPVNDMLSVVLVAVMSSSTDLLFVKDKNLRYICCSRVFAVMAGLESEKDVVGKSDHELFAADMADRYVANDRCLMESKESIINVIDSIPAADGRSRVFSISKYLLYDSSGNIIGIYGNGRDVTHVREVESQQNFLINSIPGGVATYEGQWDTLESINLAYFSDGLCRLFGYSRKEYAELSSKNPASLMLEEYVPAFMAQIERLVKTGTPIDYIYRARVKDGGCRWIHVKAVLGESNGGNMTVNAVLFDVTEWQNALEYLRISEEENRLAIQHSKNVVCRYDIATRSLRVSATVSHIFAMSEIVEDVPYGQVKSGKISPETAHDYIQFYERIIRGEKTGEMIFQRHSTLGWRWLEGHFSTIFASDGQPVSAVVSFIDVTESFEKDVAYKKWLQTLHNKLPETYSLFRCNVSNKTVFDTHKGSLLYINFKSGASIDDHTEEYADNCVYEEDRERFYAFLNANGLLNRYNQGERIAMLEYKEKWGAGYRWLRLTVEMVEYPHSTDVEAYLLFENIDQTKRIELMMIERAETDPLTGVLNRTAFIEKVEQLIRSAKPETQHALLMLDIDGFKLVNDEFGHGAGDQTLIDIANLLSMAVRRDDLIGRLGGDEFLIFLNDIPGERVAADKAKQICGFSRKSFSAEVQISASIGIALYPQDGTNFDTLYKKADETLYYVKDTGRDNYAFYREDMREGQPKRDPNVPKPLINMVKAKKRRMLIVDDNQLDYELLANMFWDDFIIEKAKDGNAALIRLRHYGSAISVVLLDLIMPGMDGFAVLQKMQQSPEMSLIPVIVVSGADDRETSLRAIREGASDFVVKPVDADILRIRVQSAISKCENERLRAKNSFLELRNNATVRYQTILEKLGIAVVEMDWGKGSFTYSPSVAQLLAGRYDSRIFWHILLSDAVADSETVKKLQQLVHEVAVDRELTDTNINVLLKTPTDKRHYFSINIYKIANEYGLTDKIILTFQDGAAVCE